MKKNIVIALAALMMLAVSCKKNIVETTNNGNNNSTVQTSDAVTRIVKFKKQVKYYKENPNIKDGEKITLEEALWNIENTFDATYSSTEESYGETKDHEFLLYLNVDDEGNVLLTDLTTIYEQMIDEARNAYINDGFTNKVFISLTARLVSVNDGIASIKVKAKTGEKTNYNPPIPHEYLPFADGDNYKYDYGTCDEPDSGEGAAHRIQFYLRQYIKNNIVAPGNGCRNIYVNRYVRDFDGTSEYPGIFYRIDTVANYYCIEWNDMNYHFKAERKAIFVTIPNEDNFQGGNVIGITISGRDGRNGDGFRYVTHYTVVDYADRIEASISDIGEIEDLIER